MRGLDIIVESIRFLQFKCNSITTEETTKIVFITKIKLLFQALKHVFDHPIPNISTKFFCIRNSFPICFQLIEFLNGDDYDLLNGQLTREFSLSNFGSEANIVHRLSVSGIGLSSTNNNAINSDGNVPFTDQYLANDLLGGSEIIKGNFYTESFADRDKIREDQTDLFLLISGLIVSLYEKRKYILREFYNYSLHSKYYFKKILSHELVKGNIISLKVGYLTLINTLISIERSLSRRNFIRRHYVSSALFQSLLSIKSICNDEPFEEQVDLYLQYLTEDFPLPEPLLFSSHHKYPEENNQHNSDSEFHRSSEEEEEEGKRNLVLSQYYNRFIDKHDSFSGSGSNNQLPLPASLSNSKIQIELSESKVEIDSNVTPEQPIDKIEVNDQKEEIKVTEEIIEKGEEVSSTPIIISEDQPQTITPDPLSSQSELEETSPLQPSPPPMGGPPPPPMGGPPPPPPMGGPVMFDPSLPKLQGVTCVPLAPSLAASQNLFKQFNAADFGNLVDKNLLIENFQIIKSAPKSLNNSSSSAPLSNSSNLPSKPQFSGLFLLIIITFNTFYHLEY